MDIENTAKRLLQLIEKSGVDEGEVYLESSSGLEMEVRDQAVERLKKRETGGYGLRLIADRRMAFVYSSDLRDESLETTVAKGAELAKMAARDEANSLVGPAGEVTPVDIYDENFDSIDLSLKVGLLKEIEKLALDYDPAIRRLESVTYSDTKADVVVANTKGVFRRKGGTLFDVGCSVIAEKDGDVETGGEEATSRFFDQLEPPSEIAKRACWKATSLLGGKVVASQAVPVILDRDTGFALLASFLAMINGDNVATGVSALKGRIGEALGSPLVTIVDDPLLKGGVASASFDDEGTPCARKVVLDRGVLRTFLCDARSASKLGMQPTGNARRGGYRALPGVETSNFYIESGGLPPEDIIASTPRGLWALSLTGWWVGINPATGDFSSGARGLWIENGRVVHPVKNVTVASNVLDMLRGIDSVGNDLYLRQRTASPTVRIAEMSIGGR